jgi:hypothetical protein
VARVVRAKTVDVRDEEEHGTRGSLIQRRQLRIEVSARAAAEVAQDNAATIIALRPQ